MRYVLILLGLLVANMAYAIDCQNLPSCTELGYSKDEVPSCAKGGYVLCPFDETYKKCVDYDCEILGFTESDKTSWCADIIKCHANKSYTLCETPCVAWDATTLTTLASSGKCKILTMLNDITLPEKTNLRLAKNTVIDGGFHTLNISEDNVKDSTDPNIYFDDLTGLKNLHVYKRNSAGNGGRLMDSGWSLVSFENVTIQDEKNGSSSAKVGSIFHFSRTISVTGVFNVKRINGYQQIMLNDGNYVFQNAKVDITDNGKGSGDILTGTAKAQAINSEINVDANGFLYSDATGFSLDNSKLKVSSKARLCYTSSASKPCLFTLENGSEFEFSYATSQSYETAKIILNGVEGHPVKLITPLVNSPITLDVQNLNAVVVYNDKTYKPNVLGETKLTEVPTSSNWTEQ